MGGAPLLGGQKATGTKVEPTQRPFSTIEANSSWRKGACSVADRCGTLFNAAWRSPSDHFPFISTTGAPPCLYCINKRRSGCFTSDREAKSPRPRRQRTNSVQPSLVTSPASRTTYLPISSGSRACCGRGIRAGRLASGSDVFLRGGVLSLLLGGVLVEGLASARPHGRGGVCGWHREHTFFSPANILVDRRQGRHDLRHCPHGPSP